MSGIGEAMAVIGAVAAVVTAYKDGGTIVNNLIERRRNRKALPPTARLGEELARGAREIESAAADGVERFGPSFLEDDVTALLALNRVTIDLQATMLKELRDATSDDNFTDFSNCIDASTTARMEAITILHEAYKRRKQKEAIGTSDKGKDVRPTEPVTRASEPSVSRTTTLLTDERTIGVGEKNHEPVLTTSRLFRKPRRSTTEATKKSVPVLSTSPETIFVSPLFARAGTFGSVVTSTSKGKRSNTQEAESSPSTDSTGIFHLNRRATSPSQTDVSSLGRLSTTSSNKGPIVPENNYAGFCLGAFRLLTGNEKGLIRKNQSTSMTGESYYDACSNPKCAFEWPARGEDTAQEAHGVKYRGSFFAKSHIQQANIKNGLQFRCLICVFRDGQSSVYKGRGALLKHASVHQAQDVNGTSIEGPLAFHQDGIETAERFDLYIASHRESSSICGDALLRTESPGPQMDTLDDNSSVFHPQWEEK